MWRKNSRFVFNRLIFLIKYIWGRMFLVISCWKLVVLSWFHQRRYKHDKFRQANIFYIPIYGYILFFSGVFYVFLDGINQTTVSYGNVFEGFWLVCHCPVWQYVYISTFTCFGSNILDNGERDSYLFTSFTFLAVLPRLFLGSTLIAVASNWAASDLFIQIFFLLR